MNLNGEKIYLKLLNVDDVTQNYINWLNDSEINEFLECRWKNHTFEEVKDYVKNISDSSSDYMFGIFNKDTNEHIGNIKIGDINQIHRYANIGLVIGNKKSWGKGYGAEAITLITRYAKNELNLNKLIAGIYENNIGSYKAFLKAGYNNAARYKKQRFYKGSYIDEIVVEKLLVK